MSLSSKLHQRCLMFLIIAAIFALVVVIVLVWVQYGNTNSRPNKKYNVTFNYEESSDLDREEFVTIGKDGATSIYQPTAEIDNEPTLPNNGKQYSSKQNNVQYVTPIKIPTVLHDHDIEYDQIHNYTLTDSNIRHHSGLFRHRGAELWDPHPQYEIEAFGKKMVLDLAQNDKAVFPKLYITHISKNNTQKRKHDQKLAGCYYTGKLKNDSNSKVTVSLCHGMTGYIHSSFGNFLIEPSDEFQNASTPLQHRITKIEKGDTSLPKITHDADQCETQDQLVIDDEIIHESVRHTHYRKKREALYFDYIDEVVPEVNNTEYVRKPRQAFKKIPQYVRRKRTEKEYYIELLVVADRTMLEYHKTQENMEHYIHTLMAHVSLLFKDATIGNPISLAVVKISIDMDTIYPPLSNEMLKKFCEWQKLNYVNDVQHDAALLLTRNQICRASDPNTCHTLGIAEVGAMCSENSSCALVRDNGLSTSYTIAHELGHLLNMRHDETSQCLGTNGGRTAGIMNKSLHNDSSPWRWSTCSKYFLTEFLDSSRSNCLLDQPQFNEITQDIGVYLPGENYEVDMQCELEFGEGSKICTHMGTTCNVLWCTTSNGGCQTQYMPWADGTTCGMNSWCHNRKCIFKNRESLTPVHGNWSAYQGWSSCSRTCGGGIRSSKRFCNSPAPANGGSYCAGGSTKYTSCNVEDCPKDSPDFREQQCAEFDGDPMTIPGLNQTVQWVPKYGMGSKEREEDYCKLYCRVKNNKEHFQLKNKVIDGTKCSLYNFGICVNGICKPGGCDNQLDSSSRLDACGVCNGDNSTCREITGHFNISDIHNYTRVTTIPKGSFNIMIKQYGFHDKPDDTFIALVGDDNKYLANQDYGISLYEKYIYYGGIKLTYSGSQNMIETVISQKYKKLQRDLYVEVVSIIHRPPDISYRYSIETNKAPKYGWHFYATNWTDCSATCNGMQTMIPVCVDLDTGLHADIKKCAQLGNNNNLRSERRCNTHCDFVWNATKTCSKHCGKGLQDVEFNCVMVNSDYRKGYYEYSVVDDKDGIPVDESECYGLRKPSEHQICDGSCDFARWIYEDWTECSKSCDRGVQSRRARCVNDDNTTVDESICEAQSKKFVIQACNVHRCPTWTYGPWSECSAPCGKGIQHRSYICDSPGSCNLDELQPVERECDVAECQWHISDWSKCSATCGDGLQIREVSCRVDNVIQVPDVNCGNLLKPDDRKRCHVSKMCYDPTVFLGDNNEIDDDEDDYHRYSTFKWNVGNWSECSKSCEKGIQSRQVLCRDMNGNIDETRCDIEDKPREHKNCNTFECPKWIHGEFGDCNSNCEKHRLVGCQHHNGTLVREDQCPNRSRPNHKIKCPCPNHTRSNDIIRNGHTSNRRFGKSLYKWKKSSWNRCSSSCGKGNQSRNVYCMDIGHEAKVVDSFCHPTRKPKDVRPCEHYDKYNCNYTWSETSWSKCSKPCNEGVKHRNVTCHKVLPGGVVQPTTVHHSHCDFHTKPPTQATCIERNCSDKHRWHADQWSKCTEACGKQGVQSRKLFCLNNRGMRVQKRLCPKEFRPLKKRKCNRFPCRYTSCKDVKEKLKNSTNTDYHLHIAGKIAVVYCFKMDTNHPEEFITLEPGRTNYAQFYDKRLHRPNSCPRNVHPDNCDCSKIPTSTHPVGKTEFWKVRLNITSMQIITEDYTFSQSTDHPQKYGHAGDCYSSVQNCIRGSFSVDLTGTSFRVSDRVTWYSSGNSASTNINTGDRQLIHGYCGGNCGTCGPHPHHGLLVEVT